MDTQNGSAEPHLRPLAVSIAEGARLIGVSKRTVENYIKEKRIDSRKLGRRRVVLLSSLERFLRHDQP
jgi:excisionase family DNA binding protein